MRKKYALLGLPFLVVVVLLQSYFWVPNQERLGRLLPDRLSHFYDGSIGDAAILNPILNADSASSEICTKVFDGLIGYDENLNYRGRLAQSWRFSEVAIVKINPALTDSRTLLGRFQQAKSQPGKFPYLSQVTDIQYHKKDASGPERIEFLLPLIEPRFFEDVVKVTGTEYHNHFPKDFEVFEHNPVITFFLRPGVRFHDGAPFSSADVKFTYQSIMDPKNLSPRTSDYEPVKDVVVIDPLTVKIIYKRLFSPAFGTWSMGILPKHLLDEKALALEARKKKLEPKDLSLRDSDFNKQPIGTGPFQFREWKRDQFIRLQSNPHYWEGAPRFKQLVFRILPDPHTMEQEFKVGALDIYNPQPHQVEKYRSNTDYQNFAGLSFSYNYIGYNLRRNLFKDARVRRALGHALNVDAMVQSIHYGLAEPISGPFLKQTPFYNSSIQPLTHDPKLALALFKEAGWVQKNGKLVNEKTGEPFRFTLLTNNGNEVRRGILTIAQQAWKDIGIEVSTQTVEWSVFIKKNVNQLDFDAIVLGWSMGIDPDLYQIWHSSQVNPSQLNFVGYQNSKADALITAIRSEYNRDRIRDHCHALHQIIAEDQPYTFLTAPKWMAVMEKNIMRQVPGEEGTLKKIESTRTGDYTYYFNEWVKVNIANQPEMAL